MEPVRLIYKIYRERAPDQWEYLGTTLDPSEWVRLIQKPGVTIGTRYRVLDKDDNVQNEILVSE